MSNIDYLKVLSMVIRTFMAYVTKTSKCSFILRLASVSEPQNLWLILVFRNMTK